MEDSNVMVQFPIGFCPGAREGLNLNCSGNFGIVLKEWETITRVRKNNFSFEIGTSLKYA